MKKIFRTMMIAMIMVMVAGAAMAQDKKQRANREQLAEMQARHIAAELALDDATTAKYVTTYCECQKEIWDLGPRMKRSEMTDENADAAIKQRFDRSQQILSIREKYYEKYRKFMTPKQIERAYQLERKAMQRLGKHKAGNMKSNKGRQRK